MTELSFPRRVYIDEPFEDIIRSIIEYHGLRRILVVTDKQVSQLDFFNNLTSTLDDVGADYKTYRDVEPEPSVDDVYSAYQELRGEFDAVIAVGGGSVIDFGKALYLYLKKGEGFDIRDVAPFNPLRVEYNKPILVVIPTTSGTGSDASYGIVLSDVREGRRVKLALGSYEIVPHITILDHRIVMGLPRKLTIGTAVDALSHAVESLVAIDANPFSIPYSIHVILTIFKYLPIVVDNPANEDARREIHIAATMAGIAFTNAGLGLAHAMAHPLGAQLKMHHGTIVGLLLPYVVRYNYGSDEARVRYEDLRVTLEKSLSIPEEPTLAHHILNLYKKVGQPISLLEAGYEEDRVAEVIDTVAELTLQDPEIVFNPRPPTYEDIRKILNNALYGELGSI